MPMHATLLQQLRSALKVSTPEDVDALLARLTQGGVAAQAELAGIAQGLHVLFASVDECYRQFERAQELRLRSLTESAHELSQANARLREESERQRSTIDSIRTMANRMLSAARQETIASGEQSADRLIAVLSELIADSEYSRAQLAQSEARFRALTGLSSDWYWETDVEGRYVYLSEGVVTLTGLAPEDCLGKTPWDAFGIAPEAAPWPAYRDCFAGRRAFREIEAQFDVYGQDLVYFLLSGEPRHGAAGEFRGYHGVARDITPGKLSERQRLEALKLTESLIELAPTALSIKDAQLRLLRVNAAFVNLFEIDRKRWLGRTARELRGDAAAHSEQEEQRVIAQRSTAQFEMMRTLPDGRDVHYIVTKAPLLSVAGEVTGIISTYVDVTELKQTEKNLIEAKQTAEHAMRARAQFLANMSHEIRTPMNGVLGMASVLAGTPLNDEQMIYVNAIRDSGESLLKIVGDILDFSKIDAGKLQIEETPFHVRSRVTSIVQLFSAAARAKNLALNANLAEDIPSTVLGDPVRVMQALSNLVANAIKFTEQGSVTLSARVAARSGDDLMLCFDVRDTGIGISRDAIERIFDPFAQEDVSTTRRYGGTGLGLSISRQLAGLMGGELAVQSVQGQGSTFSLSVKVRESHGVYPPEAVSKAVEPTLNSYPDVPVTLNVLLAEDNHVNQIVARAMLAKLGCTVTVAKDGNEVLALTGEHRFDVILMDCHMPNLDGYGATAVLRERERSGQMGLRRSVIIAQTANNMEGDRETCLAAGMDDFIPKPITIDVLAETLRRWKPKRSRAS